MKRTPAIITATIDSGETTSNEIDLGDRTLTHLFMPAAFTGAQISFLAASGPGGTFYPVVTDDGAVTVDVAQQQVICVDSWQMKGLRILKLVSDAAEGGDRIIKLQVI